MSVLWQGKKVAALLQCNSGNWKAHGVSIDSRTLKSGDLFVAITGKNFDGAQFIEDAFARGAVAVISEKPSDKEGVICVPDCHRALQALALAARKRSAARRVAVTGSVGKTGVKDALASLLNAHAAEASFNNHWGVPLSLARMKADEKFGIFEIGMNHKGEISPLSQLVQPEMVIITKITTAHIEFFNSIEGIADVKAEIFDGMQSSGVAILNRDDMFYDFLCGRAQLKGSRIVSFGTHPDSDVRMCHIHYSKDGCEVEAQIFGRHIGFSLFTLSDALAVNALAVLAAVGTLGGNLEDAAYHIGQHRPRSGRGTREKITIAECTITLIDESYNASPASMDAALEGLGRMCDQRRIAILGDMAELGAKAIQYHQDLALLVQENTDLVFLCGQNMKHLYARLPKDQCGGWSPTALELLPLVKAQLQNGDMLMVKASKVMALGGLVQKLKEVK